MISEKHYSTNNGEREWQKIMVCYEDITWDERLQPREKMSLITIKEYQQLIEADPNFRFKEDPVIFRDVNGILLPGDGWHRGEAYHRVDPQRKFRVKMTEGSFRDAWEYSLGANASNGLRRTAGDCRRAVTKALEDDICREWSNGKIAKLCHVDRSYVKIIRQELELANKIPETPTRIGADGKRRRKGNTGKNHKSVLTNGTHKSDLPNNKSDLPLINSDIPPSIQTKSGRVEYAARQIKKQLDYMIDITGDLVHAGRLAGSIMDGKELYDLLTALEEFRMNTN